jgi:sec-independent protein translocase protein TatC
VVIGILTLAALVTQTQDMFNMLLFAVPMCLLFFLGVFASYLLVLRREERKFPWKAFAGWAAAAAGATALLGGIVIHYYGLHAVRHWPFFVK